MSVLRIIQGKLGSVQQDLSEGLKSLRNSSKRLSASKEGDSPVSFNAGSDILNRYQEIWAHIHNDMESSAFCAQDAASSIGTISSFVEKQHSLLSEVYREMQAIPSLSEDIVKMSNLIGQIKETGEQLERSLFEMENVCEMMEMMREKQLHQNQLEVYRLNRESDFERVRVSLANEHTSKVRLKEEKCQSELSERQTFFEEAFNQDVEFYRTFGQTERRPSNERYGVDLADITLDNDPSELDRFLGNDDGDEDTIKSKSEQTRDASGSEGGDSGFDNVRDSPVDSSMRISEKLGETNTSNRVDISNHDVGQLQTDNSCSQ